MAAKKLTQTEVEAYDYIRRQLRDLGWVVKNPSLNSGGQVWTQNQALSHPEIKKAWDKDRPENVVKISEKLVWVIEAKASRKDLDKAVSEATNDYAKRINDLHGDILAILATGIAGNEESSYIAKTMLWLAGKWQVVTINGQEATGLLSELDIRKLLDSKTADIHDFAPPPNIYSCKQQSESMESYMRAVLTKMKGRKQWPPCSCPSSMNLPTWTLSYPSSLMKSTLVVSIFLRSTGKRSLRRSLTSCRLPTIATTLSSGQLLFARFKSC
jgi:hypothetical protein